MDTNVLYSETSFRAAKIGEVVGHQKYAQFPFQRFIRAQRRHVAQNLKELNEFLVRLQDSGYTISLAKAHLDDNLKVYRTLEAQRNAAKRIVHSPSFDFYIFKAQYQHKMQADLLETRAL